MSNTLTSATQRTLDKDMVGRKVVVGKMKDRKSIISRCKWRGEAIISAILSYSLDECLHFVCNHPHHHHTGTRQGPGPSIYMPRTQESNQGSSVPEEAKTRSPIILPNKSPGPGY